MVTPTDDGLEWYNQYAVGEAPGPIDTMAVGTGTGPEDPAATGLQDESYRASVTDSVVSIVQNSGDATIQHAIIELGGGLELPEGEGITEVGVITTATTPETLVWYDVSDPVPFPAGERNRLTIPMDLNRGVP